MTTLSSAELLAAARGDRWAREAMVDAHGGIVWALCRRVAMDPEDAFQDVWIHVFAKLGRFDPAGRASFATWLHAVTHRKLIDRGRAQTRVRTLGHRASELRPPAATPSSHGQIAARADLERGLQALPVDQRRVLLMFHCTGRSIEQIAEAEGLPVGTIKSRLHRARATLTRHLESP